MQRDINFFNSYMQKANKNGGNSTKIFFISIFSLVSVVLLTYLLLLIFTLGMQSNIKSIKTDMNSSNNKTLKIQHDKNTKVEESLNKYQISLNQALRSYNRTRVIDTSIFDNISKATPADVVISSIAVNTDVVNITCKGSTPYSAAYFSQNLMKTDMFINVTYNGVTSEKDEKNGQETFTSTLECSLKEVANK